MLLHIEKTSATSIRKSVLEPNLSCRRVGSMRAALAERVRAGAGGRAGPQGADPVDCYHGHVAHGFHHVVGIQPRYVTVLRDPVDRAVSFYYFVKDIERTDLFERHPLRDYADSVTVAQFFENPRFANVQTRRLAGIAYDRAYPRLHGSRSFTRAMLAAARAHLDAMPVFGLQEAFAESQGRFMAFVGTDRCVEGLREKATGRRMSLEEIRAVRPSLIDRLNAAHALDNELYAYAVERFAAG